MLRDPLTFTVGHVMAINALVSPVTKERDALIASQIIVEHPKVLAAKATNLGTLMGLVHLSEFTLLNLYEFCPLVKNSDQFIIV